MSEQAEAIAAEVEALPSGDSPPEAITIESPEGTQPEAKPEEPKKKGRPPANVFISQLRNQNSELLTANERLLQELEQERQRGKEKDERIEQSTSQSMVLHEGKLKAEADAARRAYEEAFIAQDPKKQADATASLARAESGLADVEAWKARQPTQQAQPKPEPKPEPQRQAPQQMDPATQGWMDENSWFSPVVNGQRNPDFNKTMHLTAVAYASRLEDRYRAEGRQDAIASQEYWDEINTHMAGQFPDEMGIESEPEVVVQKPRTTVAPAVRGAAPGAKPNGKTTITLTGEERQFVDQMRNSGAMIYPSDYKDQKLRGQRMSPNDAYITYWKQKQSDQKSQGR